jgi:hypothetical protein
MDMRIFWIKLKYYFGMRLTNEENYYWLSERVRLEEFK